MHRITTKHLQSKVDSINTLLGLPLTHFHREPPTMPLAQGRIVYHPGVFHLDFQYNQPSLVRQSSSGTGGETTIIQRGGSRQVFDQMCAFVEGLRLMRETVLTSDCK